MREEEDHRYDDMIGLPHHVSGKRPRMSMAGRAAQFSPFAALTGYDAAIREAARLTDRKIELSEDSRAALDRKQQFLRENLAQCPAVEVTYFVPDSRKEGGAYVTAAGRVKKLDEHRRRMIFTDGTEIPLDEITALTGALFYGME